MVDRRITIIGWAAAVPIVLAWWAGSELFWPARALMSLLVGFIPAFSFLQARLLAETAEPPSRMQIYFSTIFALWGLAVATAIASIESGFQLRLLGMVGMSWPAFTIWLVFCLAATMAVVIAFKAFGVTETPMLQHMIPRTRPEKIVYVGVSLTAGICEELIFRGFLVAALTVALGFSLPAALIAALVFGFAHAHQHLWGALRATLLALVLTVPLMVAGSLYPGIAAHIIIDLFGGLWLSRWLLKSE